MKIVRRGFLWWLVLLPALVSAADQSDRPEWAVGDSWTYARTAYPTAQTNRLEKSTYTQTVKARTSDDYSISNVSVDDQGKAQNWTDVFTRDLNYTNRRGAGGKMQDFRMFRWPLAEGAEWKMPWTIPSTGEMIYEGKVRGWESITVPAGTFRALRIELSGTYNYNAVDGGYGSATDVYWYAPEVKRYIRLERRNYLRGYVGANIVDELTAYHVQ